MRKLFVVLIFIGAVGIAQAELVSGLPADGLVAWFDASDLTGLADGDPVILWPKKAGIADVNDMVDWDTEDSFAPTYVASSAIFGNMPCISFVNPRYDDYLISQNLVSDYLSGRSLTIFFVSQANFHGVWNAGPPRLYFQGHKLTLGTDTQLYCSIGYPPVQTTSAIRIYTIDVANKEAQGWMDGTLKDTEDLSALPDSDFYYGDGNGLRAGAMHAGFTAEIIIYNRELDPVEINAVGYYLAQKYSITNALDENGFTEPGPIRTLSVSVTPSFVDTVEPASGTYQFLDGQTVPLNAEYYLSCPDVYEFSDWTGDANELASAQTFVIMDDDQTVTANYELSTRQCVTLTLEVSPTGVDAVTPSEGTHQYPAGETVSLEAIANYVNCPEVFDFVSWSSNVDTPAAPSTSITLNNSETVTATFNDVRVCGDQCHPYPDWDIDLDCDVDLVDLAAFVTKWLECSKPECD